MRRRKGKDPKKLRGAARMKEQGYKKVDVWLDQAELVTLLPNARLCQQGLSTFIRLAAIEYVREHCHPGGGRVPRGLSAGEKLQVQVNGPSSSKDHKSKPPADG